MLDGLLIALLIIYLSSLFFIFLFGLGQLYLVYVYRKKEQVSTNGVTCSRSLERKEDELPFVTVQLPVYNEKYVVERLLESVIRLDYPKQKLDIQLLDDSTDETTEIASRKIEQIFQETGLLIRHLRRPHRKGFKAGALQEGLVQAKGDFLAIFDADFLPPTDFLLKTLPFFQYPNVGAVQTRWGHLNDDYSLFTRLQAFGLNAHFSIEQKGRNLAGCFINFNGTAGIWRKTCVLDAGGWHDDTLTEDLDLSYRAQMKGWKIHYLEEVVSPAELPIYMADIKNQQFRWNKGGAQTAKKHLLSIWKMELPWKVKLHATLHLLNSTVFLALLTAALVSVPLLFSEHSLNDSLYATLTVFWIGIFSIALFYFYAAKENHPQNYFSVFFKRFPLFLLFMMGLSWHNGWAVAEGLLGIKSSFVRTPKFNIGQKEKNPNRKAYLTANFSLVQLVEGLLSAYFLTAIFYGLSKKQYNFLVFHGMLWVGFSLVFFQTVKEWRKTG